VFHEEHIMNCDQFCKNPMLVHFSSYRFFTRNGPLPRTFKATALKIGESRKIDLYSDYIVDKCTKKFEILN